MIDMTPIEPGYLIHCPTSNEWNSVWDYIKEHSKSKFSRPYFPAGPATYVRVTFRSGKLCDWGWDSAVHYDENHNYNDYIRVGFSEVQNPSVSHEEIMSAFSDLI